MSTNIGIDEAEAFRKTFANHLLAHMHDALNVADFSDCPPKDRYAFVIGWLIGVVRAHHSPTITDNLHERFEEGN